MYAHAGAQYKRFYFYMPCEWFKESCIFASCALGRYCDREDLKDFGAEVHNAHYYNGLINVHDFIKNGVKIDIDFPLAYGETAEFSKPSYSPGPRMDEDGVCAEMPFGTKRRRIAGNIQGNEDFESLQRITLWDTCRNPRVDSESNDKELQHCHTGHFILGVSWALAVKDNHLQIRRLVRKFQGFHLSDKTPDQSHFRGLNESSWNRSPDTSNIPKVVGSTYADSSTHGSTFVTNVTEKTKSDKSFPISSVEGKGRRVNQKTSGTDGDFCLSKFKSSKRINLADDDSMAPLGEMKGRVKQLVSKKNMLIDVDYQSYLDKKRETSSLETLSLPYEKRKTEGSLVDDDYKLFLDNVIESGDSYYLKINNGRGRKPNVVRYEKDFESPHGTKKKNYLQLQEKMQKRGPLFKKKQFCKMTVLRYDKGRVPPMCKGNDSLTQTHETKRKRIPRVKNKQAAVPPKSKGKDTLTQLQKTKKRIPEVKNKLALLPIDLPQRRSLRLHYENKMKAPSGPSIGTSLSCLVRKADEDITKGPYDSLSFKGKLMVVLSRPFNMSEFKQLLHEASDRRPIVRQRNIRNGSKSYETEKLGLSYLDHYNDLKEKLEASVNNHEKLFLLRGFFFWLKNLCHPHAFMPWKEPSLYKQVYSNC
ncbi:uncharacterized protein LOC18441876 isoform X1 [Amborella trichopoda]|uniref:uncharacterized protein LOC18441876 isoform X1 n=2 Tax=Amborella trichopoda TaxID=13333 RepID=UPI0009BEA597|nr:uncharacterized protein LOC18441876 isoform X1 [Amborella trichopoda]|eukprot:XP_020527690.1 uncharacterized protein LOC18441876 isoform X1 [Amborella trichopoda]